MSSILLRDDQWEKIYAFLKDHPRTYAGEKAECRLFVAGCHIYPDEYDSYNGIQRPHSKVAHDQKEWARDDDGDSIREVHTHTPEGMWTGLRNYLRPFRGVSKPYLEGYVAIYECQVNLKRISPALIFALVKVHSNDR